MVKEGQSLNSSVGIALGYGLDDRGSRVPFPAGAGNFSLHLCFQDGSGAHPASYPMGTRSSFPEVKAAVASSWPLTSISCRAQRMRGAIPPLPEYVFTVWCLVKHRDNFTFNKPTDVTCRQEGTDTCRFETMTSAFWQRGIWGCTVRFTLSEFSFLKKWFPSFY
jgi:hypothetical protein